MPPACHDASELRELQLTSDFLWSDHKFRPSVQCLPILKNVFVYGAVTFPKVSHHVKVTCNIFNSNIKSPHPGCELSITSLFCFLLLSHASGDQPFVMSQRAQTTQSWLTMTPPLSRGWLCPLSLACFCLLEDEKSKDNPLF